MQTQYLLSRFVAFTAANTRVFRVSPAMGMDSCWMYEESCAQTTKAHFSTVPDPFLSSPFTAACSASLCKPRHIYRSIWFPLNLIHLCFSKWQVHLVGDLKWIEAKLGIIFPNDRNKGDLLPTWAWKRGFWAFAISPHLVRGSSFSENYCNYRNKSCRLTLNSSRDFCAFQFLLTNMCLVFSFVLITTASAQQNIRYIQTYVI